MADKKASTEAVKLGKTGERMVPELHKGALIYAEHYIRYEVTQELVKDKVVLDIASGSGYGTKLLAQTAKKVYGVDIDKEAISYAKKQYGAANIEYMVGDGEKIPLADNSVDVVVTFETIEHVPNYQQFLLEMQRVLKDDGLAIVSTPNDLEFAEGNHYHLHEFTYKELKGLLAKQFDNIDSYYQAVWKHVAIGSEDYLTDPRPQATLLNFAPPKPEEYLYFFLLCSNRKITEKVSSLAALGEHYSDRYYIGNEMQHEKNLADYKQVVDELKTDKHTLELRVLELEDALKNIQESTTYKLAQKMAKVKRTVTLHDKKDSH